MKESKSTVLNDIYRLTGLSDIDIPDNILQNLINCYSDAMISLLSKLNPLSSMQLRYITSNTLAWSNKSPDEITSNEALVDYLINNKQYFYKANLVLSLRNLTYLLSEHSSTLTDSYVKQIRSILDPFFKLLTKDPKCS